MQLLNGIGTCNYWMAVAHAIIELQYNKAVGMPLYQLEKKLSFGQ